jgi:hypothetical protein
MVVGVLTYPLAGLLPRGTPGDDPLVATRKRMARLRRAGIVEPMRLPERVFWVSSPPIRFDPWLVRRGDTWEVFTIKAERPPVLFIRRMG